MKEPIYSGHLETKEGIELIIEVFQGRQQRTSAQLIDDLALTTKLLQSAHRTMRIDEKPAELKRIMATGTDRVEKVHVSYIQEGKEKSKTYLAQTFYEL